MNVRRIGTVLVIFVAAAAGWFVLGWTTMERSHGSSARLGTAVERLWGAPLVQASPSFSVSVPGSDRPRWLMAAENDVEVVLETDYRRRGLVWYPTYVVAFRGAYTVKNEEQVSQKVRLGFRFPDPEGTYDAFTAALNGKRINTAVNIAEGLHEIVELPAGQALRFEVAYKTRGIRDWQYQLDQQVGRVQNLQLTVRTNFDRVDYPEGGLSPMSVTAASGGGKLLTWQASDLITRQQIGVVIPEKLNPGPLTSRITYFAPVCLLFFFVLVATIDILYGIRIHPMHYLFVAAGFFAFHLLLAYLVGVMHIHLSFLLSASVSVFLVTSYLYAALRGRLPWKLAIAGQLFFLVLFSYSFFLEGITGLTVAIGSVVTLAILMRVTAHVDWEQVFVQPVKTPPPLPTAQTAAKTS